MTHIIAITEPDAWLALGHSYPRTVHQWRFLYRQRRFNGLEDAFVLAGGRILVDEERFVAALRRGQISQVDSPGIRRARAGGDRARPAAARGTR